MNKVIQALALLLATTLVGCAATDRDKDRNVTVPATRDVAVKPRPYNNLPRITAITNRIVPFGTTPDPIAFQVSDVETAVTNLAIIRLTSNPGVVPLQLLTLHGIGTNRFLTIGKLTNYGSSVITLRVKDSEGATRAAEFTVTVPIPRNLRVTNRVTVNRLIYAPTP